MSTRHRKGKIIDRVHPLYLPPVYQDSVDHGRLILRDGSTTTLKAAGPQDKEAIRAFFKHLSPESRYRRFFSMAGPDERTLDLLVDPDARHQLTLVASRIVEGDTRIIAVGSYLATDASSAEVAMAVDDTLHGKGLGTLLLERLALLAVRHGFVHFWATTHCDNKPMADIFRNAGFPSEESMEEGFLRFDFPVLPTQTFVERSEKLDRLFTIASLRPLLQPQSVAVIGASRDSKSVGHQILEGLISGRFQGAVYPVNPQAATIASMHCYKSVRDIREPVDLAVIVVPRQRVPSVIEECAGKGVRAVMVVTAGYAESGPDGRKLQVELLEQVRGYGMRMLGPGSMGLMNTHPNISLNASYLLAYPPQGNVALSSQSGALALVILNIARERQLGLSSFVSVGNKADVSGNDLLQYWEEDRNTRAILLYLESFGNPRRFARIARRVSRTKPIVCVKSGRGAPTDPAENTTFAATQDAAVDALFQQTGVLRAETLDEMFDLAIALGHQPLPQGRNVAILTNAAGPGKLCGDLCLSSGLLVPELPRTTRAKLVRLLPGAAGTGNPVDLAYTASPADYRKAIEILLRSKEINALIVIHVPFDPNLPPYLEAVREAVRAARSHGGSGKPVFTCLMSEQRVNVPITMENEVIPSYLFPESAARVLGKMADYAEWRSRPPGIFPDFTNADPGEARRICIDALHASSAGWMPENETRAVMEAMNLPMTAVGAPPPAGGVPVRIGVMEDDLFGPIVSFGLGGVHTEILGDVSFCITPLTDLDAQDMVRRIRGFRLLTGYKDHPAADTDAIENILLRISRLVEEVPEICEISLEPVHALRPSKGVVIAGARIRLQKG